MKTNHRENYRLMGLRISYYRKKKGHSQEGLSEMIDKHGGYISSIEAPNVKRTVSMDALFDIANALGVPAYKFLQFDDED